MNVKGNLEIVRIPCSNPYAVFWPHKYDDGSRRVGFNFAHWVVRLWWQPYRKYGPSR